MVEKWITTEEAVKLTGYDLEYLRRLLRTGKVEVKDMITHRISLEETGWGFQLVAMAQDSIKVIIEPQR